MIKEATGMHGRSEQASTYSTYSCMTGAAPSFSQSTVVRTRPSCSRLQTSFVSTDQGMPVDGFDRPHFLIAASPAAPARDRRKTLLPAPSGIIVSNDSGTTLSRLRLVLTTYHILTLRKTREPHCCHCNIDSSSNICDTLAPGMLLVTWALWPLIDLRHGYTGCISRRTTCIYHIDIFQLLDTPV